MSGDKSLRFMSVKLELSSVMVKKLGVMEKRLGLGTGEYVRAVLASALLNLEEQLKNIDGE